MKLEKDKIELVEENKKHVQSERKAAIQLVELGLSAGEIAEAMGLQEDDVRGYIA
jgi:DNA-directed RNA polymerase specialized sigma24 family protein